MLEKLRKRIKTGAYVNGQGNTAHVLGVAFDSTTSEYAVLYVPCHGPYTGQLSYVKLEHFRQYFLLPEESPAYKDSRYRLMQEADYMGSCSALPPGLIVDKKV